MRLFYSFKAKNLCLHEMSSDMVRAISFAKYALRSCPMCTCTVMDVKSC